MKMVALLLFLSLGVSGPPAVAGDGEQAREGEVRELRACLDRIIDGIAGLKGRYPQLAEFEGEEIKDGISARGDDPRALGFGYSFNFDGWDANTKAPRIGKDGITLAVSFVPPGNPSAVAGTVELPRFPNLEARILVLTNEGGAGPCQAALAKVINTELAALRGGRPGQAPVEEKKPPQFGDHNPSGQWLPNPDGYVWPKAVAGAPVIEVKPRLLASLDRELRAIVAANLRGGEEELSPPENAGMAEVDLNDDGRNEFFLGVPRFGGTGGPFYLLYSPTNQGYRIVGSIQGWGFQLVEKKNGWFQIEGMSRGGGGQYTRLLMSYGKDGYEITRNEGHDFHRGTVSVRQTSGP